MRKIIYYVVVSIFGLIVSSCTSSGVLPKGGGIYTVSATDEWNGASSRAKRTAFKDAIKFCERGNRDIRVINSLGAGSAWHLDFRCE